MTYKRVGLCSWFVVLRIYTSVQLVRCRDGKPMNYTWRTVQRCIQCTSHMTTN